MKIDDFNNIETYEKIKEYYYLKGYIDGEAGEAYSKDYPDGCKDINDVYDKVYELEKELNIKFEL